MFAVLRKISLTHWILISMVVGVVIGWLDNTVWTTVSLAPYLSPISQIFIKLIKSIVVPLIFGCLVVGIAGHGDDIKRVGRLALRSFIYFEVVTTIALFIGLGMVNLFRPGDGILLGATAETGKAFAATKTTFGSILDHAVPSSFFDAAASNNVLQVVIFTVIFAVGLSQVRGKAKDAMLAFAESLSAVMFKFTGIVMGFAPFGIAAAIAVTIGNSGLGILRSLGALVLVLYLSLIILVVFVFYPITLYFKIPVRHFWKYVKEPWLIAFSTASSEAALPLALENVEKMGVPKRIVAFVLPTGYSFNLDGSTIYLAVASIFVAQAAHIPLTFGTQLTMMITLMLTSKGVAGVPRASLVILSGTLTSFGLPLEGVAVLLGVDALMDMGRTSINLLGNCLASAVMARMEGEYNPQAEVAS
jgi:proton glutamate symport protein